MIKEGKKRVIVTLEKENNDHLEVWEQVTGYTKSEILNYALRYWFQMKGDTFSYDLKK